VYLLLQLLLADLSVLLEQRVQPVQPARVQQAQLELQVQPAQELEQQDKLV
jgi:hypothetical protein